MVLKYFVFSTYFKNAPYAAVTSNSRVMIFTFPSVDKSSTNGAAYSFSLRCVLFRHLCIATIGLQLVGSFLTGLRHWNLRLAPYCFKKLKWLLLRAATISIVLKLTLQQLFCNWHARQTQPISPWESKHRQRVLPGFRISLMLRVEPNRARRLEWRAVNLGPSECTFQVIK